LNTWIRQTHRWLSIAFTMGVITYIIAMQWGQPAAWVGFLALVPLILLLISGLYLFVLPYLAIAARRKTSQNEAREQTS
jgi:phosphotransferase system  glucose/maltose/N-acetylglucosamine-specific IIC component